MEIESPTYVPRAVKQSMTYDSASQVALVILETYRTLPLETLKNLHSDLTKEIALRVAILDQRPIAKPEPLTADPDQI